MSPEERIVEHMFTNDAFSRWLGIQCLEISADLLVAQLIVRPEMTNGFGIAHGGIAYSLADSCLAFAANCRGVQSVSIETGISHCKKVIAGDVLKAEAKQISMSKRLVTYNVTIKNQNGDLVADFKGTAFRTEVEWTVE